MRTIKRGDVWWVSFDPSLGGEIQKTRPAVVVSNDSNNTVMNRVQVVPLTSQVAKVYPSQAYVHVDGKPGKALADQLTTVTKERLQFPAGKVSEEEMEAIEQAIVIQLALSHY